MVSVDAEIKGISPILMHRFPLIETPGLEKKTPEEQAEISAYRVPDTGELYIPGTALQRALVGAAAYSKGKGRASLQKIAAACLLVEPEYLVLGVKKFEIDSRAVVVPATKGRVIRHRPKLANWAVKFTLTFDETLLKMTEVRKIVDDAGSRVGLLDYRPERKGPFGRFMVTNWETE